jgi:hypothetical protein
MCERYPAIASACPDLSAIDPQVHERAVVFVHGTVSCGIQGLKELYPALASGGAPVFNAALPVYRFEHDTFERVQDNASALARLITERLNVQHLLLAAHSRGGLVARMAMAQIQRDGYPADVSLYTFGTPHAGTPLVAIGGKALNMLYKLGEDFAGAIPVVSPLTRAYSYVYDAPTLPRGIEVMREGSDFYDAFPLIGDAVNTRAWGSDFDVDKAASGFGVVAEGGLIAAFKDRFHDLVVPSASALAFGSREPVLNCSHVHYFCQAPVQSAIQNFLRPSASAPLARKATYGTAGVQVFDDHVVIGGIRVPRRRAPKTGTDAPVAPAAAHGPSTGRVLMTTARPVKAMKPLAVKVKGEPPKPK